MTLIVKKFGGTSVGSVERIKNTALKIKQERDKQIDILVVLSAMSGATDQLIEMAHAISNTPNPGAYDVLLSTGEQVSIALLAMALEDLGCKSKTYTGGQVAIHTDSAHTKARIKRIDTEKIRNDIKHGYVVIVAGFQGIDDLGAVTTLGRGGSDTTAVAIAASMQAKECQIYTDVSGIYTCDPRIVSDARKLGHITCEEMMELAGSGAKVLQTRSVNFASKYRVPLRVLSSFDETDIQGTLIDFEEDNPMMENSPISGISIDKDEAQITLTGISDTPGIAAEIIGNISAKNIIVDMIVQNTGYDNKTDFTFTVHKSDYHPALNLAKEIGTKLGAKSVTGNDKLAKLSIVGIGMRSNAGVAQTMFSALAEENINILMISTSEIKISVALHEDYIELAARTLHKAFKLNYVEVDDDF